jgi:NAD(P)-dependent dehydrogenase (short-subunit alcohol dehydrogenase family)
MLSRSGLDNTAAAELVAELNAAGATIEAPKCDVADKDQLSSILDDCMSRMPPIRGAVLGAMVLKVGSFLPSLLASYAFSLLTHNDNLGCCLPEYDPPRLPNRREPEGPRRVERAFLA